MSSAERCQRLDRWLVGRYPKFSRTYLQALIEEGLVQVNGHRAKKRQIVSAEDDVEVQFRAQMDQTPLIPEAIPLDILFEDSSILVCNKPAGLVVHPGAGNWSHTFVNALLHHCREMRGFEGARPGIVHRLDKSTSGAIVAAKSMKAQQNLVSQFADRTVCKEYLAITKSHPRVLVATAPIGRDVKNRQRMAITPLGKSAQTHFEVLSSSLESCLILARPITGRTHQIRVHLSHLRAPILGDTLYGGQSHPEGYFLHAWNLQFRHPVSGREMQFRAPIPENFRRCVQEHHPLGPSGTPLASL